MDKVSNRDIPTSLADRLDSLMLQQLEKSRRTMQEKTFKTYRYCIEQNIKDFHSYKREADFISIESMTTIKIMEESTYGRLYIVIADRLGLLPCDIRLWHIGCNQRVSKPVDLEQSCNALIDHNKFYVQELYGENVLFKYFI